MNIKNIFFLFGILLLVIVSCSVLKREKQVIKISGTVTTTKYKIPIESNIKFYIEGKLINELTTNKGVFDVSFSKKHFSKKCMTIIDPIEEGIIKDSLIEKEKILVDIRLCNSLDTVYFNIDSTKHNLNLEVKNCGIHSNMEMKWTHH